MTTKHKLDRIHRRNTLLSLTASRSISEAAEYAGVSLYTLHRMVDGKSVTFDTLKKIHAAIADDAWTAATTEQRHWLRTCKPLRSDREPIMVPTKDLRCD